MKKRTYLDSNVSISAFQGQDDISVTCLRILDDPGRTLVVSDYVRLEVLPKPIYHQRVEEVEFMQAILDAAENVEASGELADLAFDLAKTYNLSPIDALHAAAAYVGRADELVTMEKPTKPLCQIRELTVVSLYRPPCSV